MTTANNGVRTVTVAHESWPALQRWVDATGMQLAPIPCGPNQAQRYGLTGRPISSRNQERLSGRQLEVLSYAAQGLTNAEIGRRLYLTEDTIKTHMAKLLRKLGARDRANAVSIGYRTGLLPMGGEL